MPFLRLTGGQWNSAAQIEIAFWTLPCYVQRKRFPDNQCAFKFAVFFSLPCCWRRSRNSPRQVCLRRSRHRLFKADPFPLPPRRCKRMQTLCRRITPPTRRFCIKNRITIFPQMGGRSIRFGWFIGSRHKLRLGTIRTRLDVSTDKAHVRKAARGCWQLDNCFLRPFQMPFPPVLRRVQAKTTFTRLVTAMCSAECFISHHTAAAFFSFSMIFWHSAMTFFVVCSVRMVSRSMLLLEALSTVATARVIKSSALLESHSASRIGLQ